VMRSKSYITDNLPDCFRWLNYKKDEVEQKGIWKGTIYRPQLLRYLNCEVYVEGNVKHNHKKRILLKPARIQRVNTQHIWVRSKTLQNAYWAGRDVSFKATVRIYKQTKNEIKIGLEAVWDVREVYKQ